MVLNEKNFSDVLMSRLDNISNMNNIKNKLENYAHALDSSSIIQGQACKLI